MSLNVKRSPKTTISKGLYQVSWSTFLTDRKKIVNIIFCKIKQGKDSKNELYSLIYY